MYFHKFATPDTKADDNSSKDQEPRDLYRNIEQIQIIDIEYYNQFMSANDKKDESVKVSTV